MNDLKNDLKKPFSLLGEQIAESFKKISDAANPFGSQSPIKPLKIDLSPFFRPFFKDIAKMINEAGNDAVTYIEIIVKLGYPPHLNIPIEYMRMIVRDNSEYGEEYVAQYIDELMIHFYDEKFVSEMAYEWENLSLAKSRVHLLRSVVKCHNQGMYEASIPALLPQFEGIIVDAFDITTRMGYPKKLKHLKIFLEMKTNKIDKALEASLFEYYKKEIFAQFVSGKDFESDVSRHAILHGADLNYGKQSNSLKLILAFDSLISILNDASEETIQEIKSQIG
ncbi:hypothetical protein CN918_30700 [Priestia megaterium]|nr:hypothetical protein CN918_30700 [Priestia megaterium]